MDIRLNYFYYNKLKMSEQVYDTLVWEEDEGGHSRSLFYVREGKPLVNGQTKRKRNEGCELF